MPQLQVGDFSSHCWVDDWPEWLTAYNSAEKRLRDEGRLVAADMLTTAHKTFADALHHLAMDMATWGTTKLRQYEKDTRVRPDTAGHGGPRLGDSLFCQVLVPDVIPGTIGINNEAALDAHVPWWITNEIGNDANVGRQIWGLFYDSSYSGGVSPNPDFFREHPLFHPGGGGPGTIENAIPARHFIEKADLVIRKEWLTRYEVIYRALLDDLAIVSMTFR